MAPRRNGFYDPSIREGLNNIAGIFAPPSGQEMAGFATANMRNQQASQIAELYALANNANLTPEQRASLDQRMAVLNGGWQNSQWRFNQDNATTQRAQDITARTTLATNQADNQRHVALAAIAPLNQNQVRPAAQSVADLFGVPELARQERGASVLREGEVADIPNVGRIQGNPRPLTTDEVTAAAMGEARQSGQLSALAAASRGLGTPLAVQTPRGAEYVAPGDAIGKAPVPSEASRRESGIAILSDRTQIPITRGVNEREWVDAKGQPVPPGATISAIPTVQAPNVDGITSSRTTDLQRTETETGRSMNELIPLFRSVRTDDVGVAGVANDVLTNFGGQILPGLARPDVTGTRNQLRATTLSLAKALVGDERLSNEDRRVADSVSVSSGIDESLAGARAKLATLIVLNAYRQRYANSVRTGQKLGPMTPEIVGRLTDEGVIPPDVAQEYLRNNVMRGSQQGGVVPGVNLPTPGGAATPPAASPQAPVRVNSVDEASRLPSGTPIILPDGSPGRVP